MRLYPIYFAWYTKQECAFSWRITAVIRAYHERDTPTAYVSLFTQIHIYF